MFRRILLNAWMMYFVIVTLLFTFPRIVITALGPGIIRFVPIGLMLVSMGYVIVSAYRKGMERARH